jgi:hypothetical protein
MSHSAVFLSSALINNSSQGCNISNLLIPPINVQNEVYESPIVDPIVNIPVLFPTEAPVNSADPDLVLIHEFSGVSVYKMRPFPDDTESSLIVFTGSLMIPADNITVGLPFLLFKLKYEIIDNLKFISTISNNYIEFHKNGEVVYNPVHHTPGDSHHVLFDHIRFVSGPGYPVDGEEGLIEIRPRKVHKSKIFKINLKNSINFENNSKIVQIGKLEKLTPKSELYLSVTLEAVDSSGEVTHAVGVITRTGEIYIIKNNLHNIFKIGNELILSSLNLVENNFVTPNITNIAGMHQEELIHFKELVGHKLGGLVYARISGLEEAKCMKKTRHWRRTGENLRPQ